VNGPGTPPSIVTAGWTVTLLDVDAIFAPLTWVLPHAPGDATAWLPSRALLCRRGNDVVLVDCGIGPFAGAFERPVRHVELAAALWSVGCTPEQVTAVVLTHLDDDHAGGIVDGDPRAGLRPALPSARVVMLAAAHDVLEGRSDEPSELAELLGAALRKTGVEVAGVADGAEATAGLRLRSAPGHRAGHACVELCDDHGSFRYLADVFHAREHVAHPEWDFLHDSEPDVALETRRVAIDALADSQVIIACSHVDTFGRIERSPIGPVWVDVA
jgi:glyoxylase-like metal-dependent hydrolase (beta-lactamase superfamily II)